MQATYRRLPDRAWGVQLYGPEWKNVKMGETHKVDVHRRDGSVKEQEINIFWVGTSEEDDQFMALGRIIRPKKQNGNGAAKHSCPACGHRF